MPPKRQFNDDDDDPTTSEEETTEEEESTESTDGTSEASQEVPINGPPGGGAAGAPPAATVSAVDRSGGGRNIANNPHDEAFDVEDDERVPTPGQGGSSAAAAARPSGAQGGRIENNPHDEVFEAEGDDVITPTRNEGKSTSGAAAAGAGAGAVPKGMIKNGSHDEFSDVEDDMEEESVPTPNKASGPATGAAGGAAASGAPSGSTIKNNPHDMAFDVEGESSVGSPDMSPARDRGGESSDGSPIKRPEALGRMNAIPEEGDSDVSSDISTDEDDDHNPPGGRFGDMEKAAAVAATGLPDYNPNDYAHLNAKLPPDVVDLFNLISAYQPQEMELPTKFRPFVPDYIPCVGEIDTFCKVPRPDGIPDNLGTIVVDEPSAKQSNPAVVMIGLGHSSPLATQSTFVDSLKNAHENPNAIDDWITQIKGLHAKKPLPTVNYSRPMPEIDVLLQAWPQEFEDIISSDVQFPPPHIDLDIEQYVRLLCSLLDIPIYNNMIESLHVMFTLYLEFRSNQHFQHA